MKDNSSITLNNSQLSFKEFLEKIKEQSGLSEEEFLQHKIMFPILDQQTYYLIKKNENITYKLEKRTEEELKNNSYLIELNKIEENLVEIDTKLNEFYAKTNITQYYINHLNFPVELIIKFPFNPNIQFSKFILMKNNKKVISKVIEKEKAKEKYSDAMASGNTGIISSQEENYIKINVGNIHPKSLIKLTTEFIQFLTSEDMSFCYSTLKNYPKIISKNENKKNNTNFQKIKAKIQINTNSKITRLITKGFTKVVEKIFNNDYTQCNIEYKDSNILQNKSKNDNEFKILFRTKSMNNLNLISQYDPSKNETSCILSMIHNNENIKIPINEKPDTKDSNNYIDLYQKKIINSNPSLFIFLIDQSGSMAGKPIKLVIDTLLFFLQSLPKKSYYQLIGFGSSINYIFSENPVEYTPENVKNTISILKKLKANLGGTYLFNPLTKIFTNQNYNNINLCRNLFILTDGKVFDGEESLNLLKNHMDIFRVHSFGIGKYFDKYFIKKAGKNGSYSFIEDISKIKSNVIQTLNHCLRSYLFISNISLKNLQIEYNYIPNQKICYQDEFLNFYFIIKDKLPDKINIDLQFYYKNELIKKEYIFDQKNITYENDGDIISKIIIGNILNQNQLEKSIVNDKVEDTFNSSGQTNSDNFLIEKEKNIQLSKKYQVLSKYTSLYAEIENTNKSLTDLKVVEQNYDEIKSSDDDKDNNDNNSNDDSSDNDSQSSDDKKYKKKFKLENDSCDNDSQSSDDKKYKKVREFKPDKKCKKKCRYEESDEEDEKSDNNKDEFNIKKLALSQNIIEGNWSFNSQTKFLMDSHLELYNEIKKYVEKYSLKNKDDIIITILVLYYLKNNKTIDPLEYTIIINKGLEYLEGLGIEELLYPNIEFYLN